MKQLRFSAYVDQARCNRSFDAWARHFGTPASIAAALLVGAFIVEFQIRPSQERTLAALVQERVQVELAVHQRGKNPSGPSGERNPLPQALPDVATRGKDIGALLASARRSELVVERADYAVESVAGAPLTRLHANLPVTGSYANIRKFIAEVLNAMPNATLESVQLERTDTQSARLQATLRIVLFYRTAR